jgi:hypothetical protein
MSVGWLKSLLLLKRHYQYVARGRVGGIKRRNRRYAMENAAVIDEHCVTRMCYLGASKRALIKIKKTL